MFSMMRTRSKLVTAIVACCMMAAPAKATDLPPQAASLVAQWSCETTTASGVHYHEIDDIHQVGQWLHGTARAPMSDGRVPYYDFYIGHTAAGWVYIEIDPFHIASANGRTVQGSYFVGTSHDGIDWSIVYPSGQGHYRFSEAPDRFTIAYTDLTQVCSKIPDQVAETPLVPALQCDTVETAAATRSKNYLTVRRFHPQWWTGEKSWWQGTGVDTTTGGREIYEYNFFPIDDDWISVAVNASGDYLIAKSYTSHTLDNTTWTILYPNAGPGFTFEDVAPIDGIPQNFSLVFADGYQTCCPIGATGPCPVPGEHLRPTS
jgi:hypothetical protein